MRPAVLLLLLALPLTACSGDAEPAPAPARAAAAVATLAPGPGPAAAPTALASPVARGTVTRKAGPFDDRFDLTDVTLRPDGVHAALDVTSDVSDLLNLEVAADFYDAGGRLLGSARDVRSGEGHGTQGDEHEEEAVDVHVVADPAWAARVASAVLSVPVLVNE